MQNMEKYFGFKVRVSDFLEPEDYEVIREKVNVLLSKEPNAATQYKVYMHQLVLDVQPSKFGIGGGLAGRVEKILLRFSINPKQRRTGDIKFMNYRFERELAEEVNHYYMPHMIGYTLKPSYFTAEREYFQNTIITLVHVGMREQHKKIKIRVSVEPSAYLLERLADDHRADAETNLDVDFRKAREFNRQTKLFMTNHESRTQKLEATQRTKDIMTRTILNIERVGTLINESKGTITSNTTFTDNEVFIDHLLHELRLLRSSLTEDPPAGVKADDLAVVDVAVREIPRDSGALKSLKGAGKWLGTRAESLGLTLLTEYLKSQAGL